MDVAILGADVLHQLLVGVQVISYLWFCRRIN